MPRRRYPPPVRMEYEEREHLKRLLYPGYLSTKSLRALLYCIAHWQRQYRMPAFSIYAAHWLCAQEARNDDVYAGVQFKKLRREFPLNGACLIAPACSDWPQAPLKQLKGKA